MKDLKIKRFMQFKVFFANKALPSCFIFFSFSYSWNYYSNIQSYCRTPVGISTKRAKAEMNIYPVTVKTKARKCSM